MPLFKKYKIEIVVFLLAAIVRLVFFFVCLSANGGDVVTTVHGQDWYFEISRNLILGNGFSAATVAPFVPYFYGVPAYPYFLYFLLLLTGSYTAVAMIQLLLGATIPLLGMRLARLIVPESPELKRVPIVVGIFLALAPYQILHSFIFFTETVFTVILSFFLIAFLNFLKTPSNRLAALSGVFLGLSALTKQTVQYVPVLVIIFMLWRFRGTWRKDLLVKLGCFLLAFLIVLLPWLYRNYKTFHTVSLGSGVSFNIFYTLLPSVLAIDHHTSFQEEQGKLVVDPKDTTFTESGKLAQAEIFRHPAALVKLSLLSAFTFFTHDGMLTFMQSSGITPSTYLQKPALLLFFSSPTTFARVVWGYLHTNLAIVLFARVFWIIATFFFGVGLYQLFRRRIFSPQILFSVIIVFYFMVTTMVNGLSVNARFRMPAEPIIFTIVCVGFIPIYQHLKKRLYGQS
jgi:4-amino-4-deoxy-L-arabinose transferase-like glycosyltransferase